MIKNIAIISLSSGVLGEEFVKHEVLLGKQRLEKMGLNVIFTDNALKGNDFIKNHPEKRAIDLINAFKNEEIDMIISAIGGIDTYRTIPYLMENNELKSVLKNKVFLGFSDTTTNHFMFNKLGLNTFYGQSFLPDICELSKEMLPYTEYYFKKLINYGTIDEIRPSKYWYEERKDFSEKAIGTNRIAHENKGYELLQGSEVFSGEILGGCIETIYDMLNENNEINIIKKYDIFPMAEKWKNKILLLESSESKSIPSFYEKMLIKIKSTGIFDYVNGIIVGKPMDETYYNEYKDILIKVINNKELPIIYNVNIGHGTPRTIIPFGVKALVDYNNQVIKFS